MAAPSDNVREDGTRKAKKRKRENHEEVEDDIDKEQADNEPLKKAKIFEDGEDFANILKQDDSNLQSALEGFLKSCNDAATEDGEDILMQYLEASPQCEDLLDLLKNDDRPDLVLLYVFKIIRIILIRFAENHARYAGTALSMVRRIVRLHFSVLVKILTMREWQFQKAALSILTIMVTLGQQCAQEVLSELNLNHPYLLKLSQMRRDKHREDPRMLFVQFAMSLFITGGSNIVEKVVASKDFCHSLFQNVHLDRVATLQLLIVTLRDRVLFSTYIPKKTKKYLFNNFTLSQLIELYNWKVPSNEEGKKSKEEIDVPVMVHNFLKLVCCTTRHGICYSDKSLGLDGRGANSLLLRFLTTFKTASLLKTSLMEELFLQVFKSCPDLLVPYLKERETKFTPRPYPDWLNNISIFKKIYACFPEPNPILKDKTHSPSSSRLLDLVKVTTLPPIYSREQYVQYFKGMCVPVHYELLDVCKLILEKSLRTIQFCQQQMEDKETTYSSDDWNDFISGFRESLREVFPDAEFFVGMFEKYQTLLRSSNKVEGREELSKKQVSSSPVEIPKLDAVMLRILEVLRLQQNIHPDCLDSSSLDLNSIFLETLSVSFIQTLSKEDSFSIRLVKAVMEFLRHLPPKKIRWFKENKKAGSLFSQILTLLLSSEMVRSEAEQLLCTILQETGHFENNEHEAIIWLNTLRELKSERARVIDFLKKALIKVVRNPHPFNDKVADAVAKAHMLRENEGDIHTEIASIADAGIAAILDQEEYTLDCAKNAVSMETETRNDHRQRNKDFIYCSALLPAALEEYFILSTKDANHSESISEYVTMVTMSIINQQRDPIPVSVLIKDCYAAASKTPEKEISLNVKNFEKCLDYCQFWFERAQLMASEEGVNQSKKLKRMKKKLFPYKKFSELLQDSFVIGSTALCNAEVLTTLSGLAQGLPAHKILPTCKQIMLYMQDTKDDNIPSLLGSLVYFLYIILQRASQLDEETQLKGGQTIEVSEDVKVSSTDQSVPWQEITSTLFENTAVPNWGHYGTLLSFSGDMESALGSNSLEKHFLILLDHFFASKISSQSFQKIVDNCFARINSECLRKLVDLQETTNSIQWEDYYANSDWLEHATVVSSDVFKDSISKILEILASSPEFCCKSLTELFLKLPKELRAFSPTSITNFVLSVEHHREENLDKIFTSFLEKSPDVSLKSSVDLLDHSLSSQENKELYRSLAISLISHNPLHRMYFTRLICTDGGIKQIKRKLKKDYKNFSHIVYSYLSAVAYQRVKSDEDLKAEHALQENLWPLLLKLYKGDSSFLHEGDSRLLEALCKLLDTLVLEQTLDDLCSEEILGSDGARLILIDTLLSELSNRDSARLQPIRMTVLGALLESCAASDANEERYRSYQIMLTILEKSSTVKPESKFISHWKAFVRKGLKLDYQKADFQNVLRQLLPGTYPDASKKTEGLLPIEKLFNMIINHSSFLPTMLGSDEQKNEDTDKIKGHVIASLLFIVKRAPSCCNADHLVVMLGAYGATRSHTDQLLLEMLEVYEKNISELDDYRYFALQFPYLWGQAAVDHYTSRKTLGKNLWTQPTMKEVLDLLNPAKIYQTALQFPLDQPLSRQEEATVSLASEESDLYDPSFLLPLFSFLLAPENVADCQKFIACNALLLSLASLSSMYGSMREAGYFILSRFEQHLEGARFRGRREISYLLTCLKNTVPEPNACLPSVITMFVGKSAYLMLNPGTSIFKHILQYITIEPKLNLNVIPAFNGLFFSSSEKHIDECNWILHLLKDGLRDFGDFTIYTRNNVWSLLLSFKSSPHCSQEIQDTILSIVKKAVAIPQAAVALVSSHSLLLWTLSSPDPLDHVKTIPILETVLDSVVQFWKKNPSPELCKTVVKMFQELLLNCQTLLQSMKSPSLDLLRQVLLMTQKCLLQLEQLNENDTNLSESSCIFTEKSFQNLIQLYQKTTQDPCFCFKGCKTKKMQTIHCEEGEITPHERLQEDWMTKDDNKETASSLYYLIWYWLKNSSSVKPANENSPSGGDGEELSCLGICWCLNHFVRCKGEVPTPKMSDLLKIVLMRLRANPEEAQNLSELEERRATGGSFLSVYNVLNRLAVRSGWTHLNCEEKNLIEDAINQILLQLSEYMSVGDAFKVYLKEWSQDQKEIKARKQEHLTLFLRELWSGFEKPSAYECLSAT
ncbi:Nucleolar pre-ribosomal-associated protein 1 [Holothuria leucospilota]|uniref:Nucleolar pre-ribosomal-associated protein 1 n=1 Tax=Holothuria leucospilota TaxID=206669 RepID=A0A9Q0YU90_HOLLE|nr:Nucleolar pre-ribosomal-associated protein 1 [Holothuria leucospilota]